MRRLTAVTLLVVVIGAIFHFWPDDQSSTTPSEPKTVPSRDSPAATANNRTPTPQAETKSAPLPERALQGGTLERPAVAPVQITVHAPQTVRLGETFPVTIEVQATQGIRQLAFSVVYNKQILELVESSPGAFARPGGPSAHFEEVSEGSLLVRIGYEGGVIAGAGSVGIVQFRTLRRGVSPLAINGVTYVADGSQNESSNPIAYEGTITVE